MGRGRSRPSSNASLLPRCAAPTSSPVRSMAVPRTRRGQLEATIREGPRGARPPPLHTYHCIECLNAGRTFGRDRLVARETPSGQRPQPPHHRPRRLQVLAVVVEDLLHDRLAGRLVAGALEASIVDGRGKAGNRCSGPGLGSQDPQGSSLTSCEQITKRVSCLPARTALQALATGGSGRRQEFSGPCCCPINQSVVPSWLGLHARCGIIRHARLRSFVMSS
jgi:hypothetical protein